MKELNWASVLLCKRLIWLLEELFLKAFKNLNANGSLHMGNYADKRFAEGYLLPL